MFFFFHNDALLGHLEYCFEGVYHSSVFNPQAHAFHASQTDEPGVQ